MISGFDSVKDFGKFVFAREFWEKGPPARPFPKGPGFVEKVANTCTRPILGGLDLVMRNFKEPMVVTALTMASIAMVTFLFYPDHCADLVSSILPGVKFEPWMVKAGAYVGSQMTIAGLGIRTLGRLNNAHLMEAWKERRLIPIAPGTVVEQVPDEE